jgi:hypothetical protein
MVLTPVVAGPAQQVRPSGWKLSVSPPPPKPRVVIAAVETRFCLAKEKNPRWKRDYTMKRNMRRSGAAVNLHYAEKHGYEFRMYCHGEGNGFAEAWLKVSVLEDLFTEAKRFDVPTYIMLIDSDVYVRKLANECLPISSFWVSLV